jgi:hypothetical protein
MRTPEEIERALQSTGIQTTDALDEMILRNAGLALDTALAETKGRPKLARPWKGVVTQRPLRAAVATAVLVSGVFLSVLFVNTPGERHVAWAQVSERMAQVDRLMFRLSAQLPDEARTGDPEAPGALSLGSFALVYFGSADLGARWDLYESGELISSILYPLDGESGIAINHQERTWSRVDPSGDAPVTAGLFPILDPQAWVKRFLERDGNQIGQSSIDGVEVEGLEVIDPPTQFGPGNEAGPRVEGTGRLWVSVGSGLPVRIEIQEGQEGEGVTWTLDFRWGAQVDPGAFESTIPEGYTLVG